MIKVLKERFGEANQSDKYRLELKSRRRRPNETLRSLYLDTRRLTALALPDHEHRARETMACDYFIDALNDPNFASASRKTLTLHYELHSNWKYGLPMSPRTPEESVGPEK